jgi:glucose-6-phosphate isomerase
MKSNPISFTISLPDGKPNHFDNHVFRKLSSMKGQFMDQISFKKMLSKEDTLLYEVYEISRPEISGEMIQGTSIVHPGKVGNEYFMTKGHFHVILDTAEIYYCLQGSGMMVMETMEGNWAIEELKPDHFLYVPPAWAHRSVNISPDTDLITYFIYPANAGHDYGTIETKGFRKLIVEQDGRPAIMDNLRWKS